MKYTPIRIRSIKPGITIPFSLFIHFKEQYLEYYSTGSAIEEEKYLKLKKQKIAKFYITDTDEPKYQSFIDELLDSTLDDSSVSVEAKVDLLEGASQTAIERLAEDPASKASFEMTESAAKKLRRLVMENPDALKGVFGHGLDTDPIVKHSLNVCVLCIKFAEEQNIEDEEIDMLATAALMHDVGILKLDDTIKVFFGTKISELNHKDKALYYEHTLNVVTILRDKNFVTEDIIDLVQNHEENRGGSGPNGKIKLSKLEEILSMIDTYDEKILSENLSPGDAIKAMMIDEMGNYELSMMQDFQKFLKREKIS